jgi:hypothetical protein
MIADHARKDAPHGSYSWRFIDESIKLGRLANQESHQIRPPVRDPVAKATRKSFTPEDDQILMEFVLGKEALGEALAGQKIYYELAEQVSKTPWTICIP